MTASALFLKQRPALQCLTLHLAQSNAVGSSTLRVVKAVLSQLSPFLPPSKLYQLLEQRDFGDRRGSQFVHAAVFSQTAF